MTVWRGWVLPVLKVLALSAVAVALVKIAFFPAIDEEELTAVPTGEILDPTVVAEVGSVTNDLNLPGSISAVASTPARATLAGRVASLNVAVGQAVNEGETIAVIQSVAGFEAAPVVDERPGIDESAPDADAPGPVVAPIRPPVQETAVLSPITGTVTAVPVLVDQELSVGDTVIDVSPNTFEFSATIAPEQLYALQNEPEEATVSITGGPADVACTRLVVHSTGAITTAPDESAEGVGQSGPRLTCAVPDDVTVFNGLSATATIAGSSVEDVIVAPATAVLGNAGAGTVYVPGDDGVPVEKDVEIGLSDGRFVEIRSGLDEGQELLEFIPVDDPSDSAEFGDPCAGDEWTAEECEGFVAE